MRHGRNSTAPPLTGDQRHGRKLLGATRVVDAVAQPAHQAEPAARETLWPALEAHGPVRSLAIDRADRSRPLIGALKAPGSDILAKPWPLRPGGCFTKKQLQSTLERPEGTCPAGVMVRLTDAGRRAPFPATPCGQCALQAACTTSARGRTLRIHPQEALVL